MKSTIVDDPGSPEFRAALERALVAGSVEWLDASTYGLPPDQLAEFKPPPELLEEPDPAATPDAEPRPVKEVANDLSRAVASMSSAMLSLGKNAASQPKAISGQTASGGSDAYAELEKVAKLRDAGILTDEEFASKKQELLQRI